MAEIEKEMTVKNVEEPRKGGGMRVILMLIIAALIIAVGVFTLKFLMSNKVEAKKVDVEAHVPTVKVVAATKVNVTPRLELEGVVSPAKRTVLISEVSGAVVEISSRLEVGNVLEKDEVILRINDADYRTQLASVESSLADAELVLAQEKARAAQSTRDWKKLGNGKPATELVRRLPQIKSASARITAAKAAIAKAKRDVAKTVVRAPYRCLVEAKNIEEGAYVAARTQIAAVYSDADFEVRLPVSLDEVGVLPAGNGLNAEVKFSTLMGGVKYRWNGRVDRFEGGIDTKTFSMVMMAKVAPNESQDGFVYPPKGLFLKGEMQGEELIGVIQIPRVARREGDRVWLLTEENKLRIIKVNVVYEDRDYFYVQEEIKAGDKVIMSPIAIPLDKMDLVEDVKSLKKEM